jgi:hypothetical protein
VLILNTTVFSVLVLVVNVTFVKYINQVSSLSLSLSLALSLSLSLSRVLSFSLSRALCLSLELSRPLARAIDVTYPILCHLFACHIVCLAPQLTRWVGRCIQ